MCPLLRTSRPLLLALLLGGTGCGTAATGEGFPERDGGSGGGGTEPVPTERGNVLFEVPPGRVNGVIVRFDPKTPAAKRLALHEAAGAMLLTTIDPQTDVVSASRDEIAALLRHYAADPAVLWTQADVEHEPTAPEVKPNDPMITSQWHLAAVRAFEAWSVTTGRDDVLVAVCDTGFSLEHPDLAAALRTDLCANLATDQSGDCGPVKSHGTLVAGTVAAVGNNGAGLSGLAWRTSIAPLQVSSFDNGAAFASTLAKCIRRAADLRAAVVNVSFSTYLGSRIDPIIAQAAVDADARGTLVVIAAGNENTNPAGSDDPQSILYVGATGRTNQRASFSNHGAFVDLVAPGVDILTTSVEVSCTDPNGNGLVDQGECRSGTNGYGAARGTSLSAPIVTGVAALMKAANPGATPAEIRNALVMTTRELGKPGEDDEFGSGLLDAYAAVSSMATAGPVDPPPVDPPPTPAQPPLFTALTPARLLDTRSGIGGPQRKVGTLDGLGQPLELQIAGRGGVPVSGAAAASLTVTVTGTTAPSYGGYVTVYPCGSRPDASNVNFRTGQTVPNAVLAALSPSGTACLYVHGNADLLVDINGWFSSTGGFTAMTPQRFLDTRQSVRIGARDGSAPAAMLQVTGRGGVPASGVSAVSLNITAVDTTAPDYGGYVTVYPCGTPPDTSSLNFVSGAIVSNAVVTPLSGAGALCLYVHGQANLLVDVNGWFTAGRGFTPLTPARVLDTRNGIGAAPATVGAEDGSAGPLEVRIAGTAGVPGSGATAVSLNLTAVDTTAGPYGGYVTVYPCGARPDTSSLNFQSSQIVPNAVLAPLSAAGTVCLYVYGRSHLLVDVNGWFAAP